MPISLSEPDALDILQDVKFCVFYLGFLSTERRSLSSACQQMVFDMIEYGDYIDESLEYALRNEAIYCRAFNLPRI